MIAWLHAFSAAAAAAMVMGVVEGLALTVCVAMVLWLCPGLSAGVRSAVWTAALAMTVLLPAASLEMDRSGAGVPRGSAEIGEGWALGMAGVWAMMSAVRLGMLAVSGARLRRVWRRATPIDAGTVCETLLRAGRRPAELCLSDDVDRPSVVGFLRPRVLFPAELLHALGPEQMEHIVRHEMEHLERRDDWTNLLQKLSLAVFPLNPVLFWLDRRLCQERELACDDGVLRQTRARKAYAGCLASLAATQAADRIGRRASALALGAWGRESELSRRVHRILSWRESGMARRPALAVAAALMLSVAGGGMEMARCPQLLRFTGGAAREVAAVTVRPVTSESAASAGAIEPVVAWTDRSATAKPMLVKAVMPEVRATGVRTRSMTKRRVSASAAGLRRVRQVPVRRRAAMETVPRTVLTAWPVADVPAQWVLTVAGDGQRRYAAFATRDGWLFVSL